MITRLAIDRMAFYKATCITECTASASATTMTTTSYAFIPITSNCIQHLIQSCVLHGLLFLVICMTSCSTMSFLYVMCQPIVAFLHLSGTAC